MQITQDTQFNWHITHGAIKIVLRDLTINDIFWLREVNLRLDTSHMSYLALYNRLIVSEGSMPTDWPLAEYNEFMRLFITEILANKVFSPDDVLEPLWFIGGQSFTPDIQKWFDVPLTLIVALAEVAKKYPPTKLA